jgi:alpha-beta hydrolase superfamily lysophospholipase
MGGLHALLFTKRHRDVIPNYRGTISQCPAIAPGGIPPNPALIGLVRGFIGGLVPKVTQPNGLDPMGINSSEDEVVKYLTDPLNHGLISVELVRDMYSGADVMKADAPKLDFPLLMYHNEADLFTSPVASKAFFETVASQDKKYFAFPKDLKLGHERE